MEKNKKVTGEKLVYGLARVLAVGVLMFGLGVSSLGVLEAWEFFTEGSSYYSRAEEIVNGVLDLVGVLFLMVLVVAVSAVLWFLRKVKESVDF